MAKDDKKPELQDNPAEYTHCQVCDVKRKLPDPCRCERKLGHVG